jgi:hypothetical protein
MELSISRIIPELFQNYSRIGIVDEQGIKIARLA